MLRERENRRERERGATRRRESGGGRRTRDATDALSLVRLLSAAVLRVRTEPTGSFLLNSEGAGRDGEEGGAVGEAEEGRSRQQSTRDDVDASPSALPFHSMCLRRAFEFVAVVLGEREEGWGWKRGACGGGTVEERRGG